MSKPASAADNSHGMITQLLLIYIAGIPEILTPFDLLFRLFLVCTVTTITAEDTTTNVALSESIDNFSSQEPLSSELEEINEFSSEPTEDIIDFDGDDVRYVASLLTDAK